ncbi:MAG: response regulator transcription factor [Nannocystis sp.]|nr:response regulator transcription factor [Nannocystis sp.]
MSDSDAPLRVILAEDHTIVREGLRALLSARSDMSVVAEVGDGQAAVEAATRLRPDVIVMDLGMPLLNGVDATAKIREQAPGTQVLILSMQSSEAYVRPGDPGGGRWLSGQRVRSLGPGGGDPGAGPRRGVLQPGGREDPSTRVAPARGGAGERARGR